MIASPAPVTAPPETTPPHAPERGWSFRILGPFHITGVFWYRFHLWLMRSIPSFLFEILAVVFTTFFFIFLRRIRAAITSNLEPVLGPCGWWERQRRIYRTMWQFGWCLNERNERLNMNGEFAVELEAIEHWNEVSLDGGGLILVTAHLGNYEVGSMLPSERESRRVHLVREPEADAKAQAFFENVVADFSQSQYTMHFQSDDPFQGLALLDALRRGEIVAMQGDRPRAGGWSIDAMLFGKPFPLPPGPAVLARTAGVPILPVFVFREGRRRYRVVFRPPILSPRTGNRAADLQWTMQRVAADLEWAVRREPHQWFCFKKVWP